jgi:hypothetical protein
VIISTEAEKAFEKIQYPYFFSTTSLIKVLMQLGIKETYFNLIRPCDKPTANIILN